MRRFNLTGDDWDRKLERPGFRNQRVGVGERVDGKLIGASLYELPPGEATFPYHLHHANEEWLIVVAGRPTLRTPDGERELRPGDTVCFPRGPAGAHRIDNSADEPARVLIFSTEIAPEVAEYPDSGKVGVWGEGFDRLLRGDAEVDYWEGE